MRALRQLTEQIQGLLTPDLLREPYRSRVIAGAHPHTGHCYVASEAIYHLAGRACGYRPMFVRHEDAPHWFLALFDLNDNHVSILDATVRQFRTPVPYAQAIGKGFLTKAPSQRARTLMDRWESWSRERVGRIGGSVLFTRTAP